ncbi:hypothetical protein ACELLULO517_27210 [Acidisoma cellulosilytica]|uniref:Uncharacterized protein n=1 Tax=Acidisoma cellulosilyticum TaxID=2802395 RepID=A0A963Z7J4_9PROT|nr:hypothetical protein [Acidisoma cellulosilyticum]MCB8883961.1 hypothetical protein [Acidisoma cellulosilyticum]
MTLGAYLLWSGFGFATPGVIHHAEIAVLMLPLFVMLTMAISIALGALGAKAACSAFGRLPVVSLLLLLPMCGFAMWLQVTILTPAD